MIGRMLQVIVGAYIGFSASKFLPALIASPGDGVAPAPSPAPSPSPAAVLESKAPEPPPFKTEKVSAISSELLDLPTLRPPQPLQFVTPEEATEEWRKHHNHVKGNGDERHKDSMAVTQSIYYQPSSKLGKKNRGYICVAVLACCDSWELTKLLLDSLTAMSDPIHVVVIDDASEDGLPEKAAAYGYPVLGLAKNLGATHGMNRAWQYFTAHPELQSLFILNNDVIVSDGAFKKLHRCVMEAPTAGVVGPMTNANGLGQGNHHQNAEHKSTRHFYQDEKPPKDLIDGLPDTLHEYNKWMEGKTADQPHTWWKVRHILGFFMGVSKRQPIADNTNNILLRGGRNLHQEYWLFDNWRVDAYVCLDVFAFHEKAATLKAIDGHRVVVKP